MDDSDRSRTMSQLADLIQARNIFDDKIAALIGRPALDGHIGEYIAAEIFGIELWESAAKRGSDGCFAKGPLTTRTVNIKLYRKRENLLDLRLISPPEYYLVLTGPKSKARSSRNTTRPLVVESVYLFDSNELHDALCERRIRQGNATSITEEQWNKAEIYPEQRNDKLIISIEQRALLALFR